MAIDKEAIFAEINKLEENPSFEQALKTRSVLFDDYLYSAKLDEIILDIIEKQFDKCYDAFVNARKYVWKKCFYDQLVPILNRIEKLDKKLWIVAIYRNRGSLVAFGKYKILERCYDYEKDAALLFSGEYDDLLTIRNHESHWKADFDDYVLNFYPTMANIGDRRLAPYYIDILNREGNDDNFYELGYNFKRDALRALRIIGSSDIIPVVIQILESEHENKPMLTAVSKWIESNLNVAYVPSLLKIIEKFYRDKEYREKIGHRLMGYIINIVGMVGDQKAVPLLTEMSVDKSLQVTCLEAINALNNIKAFNEIRKAWGRIG